jgi:phosphoserine phosphatase
VTAVALGREPRSRSRTESDERGRGWTKCESGPRAAGRAVGARVADSDHRDDLGQDAEDESDRRAQPRSQPPIRQRGDYSDTERHEGGRQVAGNRPCPAELGDEPLDGRGVFQPLWPMTDRSRRRSVEPLPHGNGGLIVSGKDLLPSWNDGAAKAAIVDFVEQTVAAAVPIEERIAVFDADGTLWCEQPLPVEADFILRRLAEMAKADPALRERQPWKAAYEHDNAWFGKVIAEHYAGDDTDAKVLLGGVAGAFADIGVEDFEAKSDSFLRSARHPSLGRGYLETAYTPMVELLAYLEANGFTSHIVSGSGGDFMRPISQDVFGIPIERVIGSATVLEYASDGNGGTLTRKAQLGFLDDGPQKPIHIWARTGRRPLVAGGNSNGDLPMLEFAQHDDRPTLRLLVLHDDSEREFAYTNGAEKALAQAKTGNWTVVSMKDDFAAIWRS